MMLLKPCPKCGGAMTRHETKIIRIGAPDEIIAKWKCESCNYTEGHEWRRK